MILLSALLASLSGFVAGERPVGAPAQVQASAAAVAAETEAAAVVSQAQAFVVTGHGVAWAPSLGRADYAAPVQKVRSRLALKQSWLN